MSPLVAQRYLLAFAASITLTWAYSFEFQNTPTQCSPVQIGITGSGGSPPYNVLTIPFGGSPLPNGVEVRRIVSQNISGSDTSTSITLNYPADSQFIVVVSDMNGFGTGGTSVAATVQSSSNAGCFNASQGVSPDFFLSISPSNQFIQCVPTRLFWDASAVQGNVVTWGVIPGGESFFIPVGDLSTIVSFGTGYNFTVDVRTGTALIIGAGDNRGLGSGGSVSEIVSGGIQQDTSCINGNSPSSTAAPYAGGSYPTTSSGDTTTGGNVNNNGGGNNNGSGGNGSGSHSTNVGAIVGGVVGGVIGALSIFIFVLFLLRRRRYNNRKNAARNTGTRQTDLLDQPDSPAVQSPFTDTDARLQAEPYIVPQSNNVTNTVAADYLRPSGEMSEHRQSTISVNSSTPMSRTLTPIASSSNGASTRKTAAPPQLRPVNIIQHADAGSVDGEEDTVPEPETVELPPQYTSIGRN